MAYCSKFKAQGSRLKAQSSWPELSRMTGERLRLVAHLSEITAQGSRFTAQVLRLSFQGSEHKAKGSQIKFHCSRKASGSDFGYQTIAQSLEIKAQG